MKKRRAVGRRVTSTRKRATARRRAATGTTPSVVPMISYEDGIAALEWLHRAFGFRETARHVAPDGRLSHGEMQAGDGLVMLASPTPDYQSPKRHREVLVLVDNLEQHFARAKAAGARILSDIESDPPGRRYRAEDFEGHRWFFFQKR
jgi:uncharacterized glyoxalase superfamily protein PhnB